MVSLFRLIQCIFYLQSVISYPGNMLQLILDSPYGKYEFEWQNTYGTVYAIKGCLGVS